MVWQDTANMAAFRPALQDLSQIPLEGPKLYTSNAPSCSHPQISCRNTSVVENMCCFNAPGGQILQTQFWDTKPPVGPSDSWTLHGLWPDHCDGGFDQYCDSKRKYNNITSILESFGAKDLLKDMKLYWKDYKGDDENLWSHEWNKHGTCISTLSPKCYSEYRAQSEVIDYFQTSMNVFKSLPSYEWLEEAGIVPSTSKTYDRDDIVGALSAHHGMPVTIRCRGGTFDEIWYHFDVQGSVQTGEFLPTEPDGPKTNCPRSGIRYLPKKGRRPSPPPSSSHSHTPTSSHSTSHPKPTGSAPFKGKGYLKVKTEGHDYGCILSRGRWYSRGTCATFTAKEHKDGFILQGSRGRCALNSDGAILCSHLVLLPTVFDNSDSKLQYNGSSNFYSDHRPEGFKQEFVYTEKGEHKVKLHISWEAL